MSFERKPGIQLGSAQTPGESQTVRQIAQDRVSYGYETEQDRQRAREKRDFQAKVNAPKIQPSILIAALAAVTFVVLVLVFRGSTGAPPDTLGYDNKTLLSDYEKYLQKRPSKGLPSLAEVRQELNEITFLENMGRVTESRQGWRQVMTEQKDLKSPVFREALKRLKGEE